MRSAAATNDPRYLDFDYGLLATCFSPYHPRAPRPKLATPRPSRSCRSPFSYLCCPFDYFPQSLLSFVALFGTQLHLFTSSGTRSTAIASSIIPWVGSATLGSTSPSWHRLSTTRKFSMRSSFARYQLICTHMSGPSPSPGPSSSPFTYHRTSTRSILERKSGLSFGVVPSSPSNLWPGSPRIGV